MARNETVLGLLSTDDAASQQDDPWTSPHDHGLPPLPHLHPDDPIDNQSDLVADFVEGGLEGAPPAQMLEAATIAELALREQDRLMPLSNVAKLMAKALPHNAKITRESKHAMQEIVSEAILFVTSEAMNNVREGNRRSMRAEDLASACRTLDLTEFAEVVEASVPHEMQQSTGSASASASSSQDSTFSVLSSAMTMNGSALDASYFASREDESLNRTYDESQEHNPGSISVLLDQMFTPHELDSIEERLNLASRADGTGRACM